MLYVDLIFDDSTSELLREEISELTDTIALYVNVYDSKTSAILGQGVVELWNMIEHSCNILRHVSIISTCQI
jgi:hypothetical protein